MCVLPKYCIYILCYFLIYRLDNFLPYQSMYKNMGSMNPSETDFFHLDA